MGGLIAADTAFMNVWVGCGSIARWYVAGSPSVKRTAAAGTRHRRRPCQAQNGERDGARRTEHQSFRQSGLQFPGPDGIEIALVHQATNYEAGKAAYSRFLGKWSKELPKVVRSLEEAGEELLTFYAFPQEQWKCLRTTNPIERLNGEFKRRVKTQCSLPSEDSAMLILFGLILSEQIRFRKIDGWQTIVEVYGKGSETRTKAAS